MSYEPLHHKYRPQRLEELVGQDAIASTLTQALISGRIAPAYLFTGPRGTGKTSSARILAKSLNCLQGNQPTAQPCGVCDVCISITRGTALDVIEIDAASNTGVDNIREIIEKAQFAPVQCRYKVYVIDECHMLSTAAFNALLKTLEEPPNQVIFILATTDPQRVLPTIISRCQRFDYRRIPLDAMAKHLAKIASLEEITLTKEALDLIAQLANGGLRDAQSLLDQLSLLKGEITPEKVWDLVGATPEQDLLKLLTAIAQGDSIAALTQVRAILARGREPLTILQNLASFYLNLLIAKTAPSQPELFSVTAATRSELVQLAADFTTHQIIQGQQQLKTSEVQLKNTTQPHLWLEVTLLGLLPTTQVATPPPESPTPTVKVSPPPPESPTPTVKVSPPPPPKTKIKAIYTDGSCLGNPGPGGWSYVVYWEDGKVVEAGGKDQDTTNQKMELQGAIAALKYLQQISYPEPVTIYTDSQYVIKGITTWIESWQKNGWQTSSKKPVVNQELWMQLHDLNQKFTIHWTHVAAHRGNEGNERADTIARNYASGIGEVESEPPRIESIVSKPSEQEVQLESPPSEPPSITGSHEAIWQKMLAHLQPATTRALLEQQGTLLSFDGTLARVGINSEKLLKLHKGKVSNIETAFQSLTKQPVKVSLEVTTIDPGKKSSIPPTPPRQEIKLDPLPPPPVPAIQPEEKNLEPTETLPPDLDEQKLLEVAQQLAKAFQGEVIDLG